MQNLSGKVAFITGGASGIGFGIASALADAGSRLILADLDAGRLETAASQLEGRTSVSTEVLDVTDPQAWAVVAGRVESRCGGVDVLVNNAGITSAKQPLEKIAERDWRWIFDVNLHGLRNGLATWLPRMKARATPAHIVNTASILGHFGMAGVSDYVASKFAVVGMTECLRLELQGTPIGVSLLCPGLVATNLAQGRPVREGDAQPAVAAMAPQGIDATRVGRDVVEAIRSGRFHVFTHPEYAPVLAHRHEEMQAGLALAAPTGEDISLLGGGFLALKT